MRRYTGGELRDIIVLVCQVYLYKYRVERIKPFLALRDRGISARFRSSGSSPVNAHNHCDDDDIVDYTFSFKEHPPSPFLRAPYSTPVHSTIGSDVGPSGRGQSFVTADTQIICINTRRPASRNEDIKGSHIDQTAVSPRAVQQFPSVHLAATVVLSLQSSHPCSTGPSYILTITRYPHRYPPLCTTATSSHNTSVYNESASVLLQRINAIKITLGRSHRRTHPTKCRYIYMKKFTFFQSFSSSSSLPSPSVRLYQIFVYKI